MLFCYEVSKRNITILFNVEYYVWSFCNVLNSNSVCFIFLPITMRLSHYYATNSILLNEGLGQ
jgi:hypothetical protein